MPDTINTSASTPTNTTTTTTKTTTPWTQTQIEEKLKTNFTGLNDSNITILAHYLYKNPKKWSQDDDKFVNDVNKLIPEAFAHNMMPSNALFGAIIAILVVLLIGLIWWVVTIVVKKNKNAVLPDPSIVNPAFI